VSYETTRPTRLIISLSLLVLLATLQPPPGVKAQPIDSTATYYKLGLEATNWISSFQLTPLNITWGIPYQNEHTWGLDPFYFDNGTITAGTGGIKAGERQTLAFLIGGHDSGLGASAALDAYVQTGDTRYLKIFNVYFDYFQHAQIPSARTRTSAQFVTNVKGKLITIDNAGTWAEQAAVTVGANGHYGTGEDNASLLAVFPSPEHGNPIAIALISYYRLMNDSRALQMLNRYGNWLVETQIKNGNYSGAFPVTQYYWALGWKPRMFETTESTWVLSQLYSLSGNRTYLNSAISGGQYMLLRQFAGPEWSETAVYGALPYESNGTKYTTSVSTNHAGFTLLAWTQLYRLTRDNRFLAAAEKYANWLLSFQVTTTSTSWGNHTYANDSMAVGGYYYGYETEKHQFGSETALSLWSAAYSVRGLLDLSFLTGKDDYLRSALLAADWLTRMRYPDSTLIPLQALATTKYVASSWWGLYPQFYQPDMREVEKAGIPSFVAKGQNNPKAIKNQNLTWFEQTFGVDFNLIDYQMAKQGPQFMKMVWSWWPDLGFEPRYGGDLAFGEFSVANYLFFNNELDSVHSTLSQIEQLISDQSLSLPANVSTSYHKAQKQLVVAEQDFNETWYSAAIARLRSASNLAEDTLKSIGVITSVLEKNRTVNLVLTFILIVAVTVLVYFFQNLRKESLRKQSVRRRKRSVRSG
jgi:hypothetical protein